MSQSHTHYRWLALPLEGNEHVRDALGAHPICPYPVRITADAIEVPVADLADAALRKGSDGRLWVTARHVDPMFGEIRLAAFDAARGYRAVELLSDLTDLIRSTLQEPPKEVWRPDAECGRLVGTRYEPGWTLDLSCVPRPSRGAAATEGAAS